MQKCELEVYTAIILNMLVQQNKPVELTNNNLPPLYISRR